MRTSRPVIPLTTKRRPREHGLRDAYGYQRALTQHIRQHGIRNPATWEHRDEWLGEDRKLEERLASGAGDGLFKSGCVPSVTDPEIRAFLLEGTRTGKLSYLGADGRPLVVPVWFVIDDVCLTGKDSAKGRSSSACPCPRQG